jgi:hypothetical protein
MVDADVHFCSATSAYALDVCAGEQLANKYLYTSQNENFITVILMSATYSFYFLVR